MVVSLLLASCTLTLGDDGGDDAGDDGGDDTEPAPACFVTLTHECGETCGSIVSAGFECAPGTTGDVRMSLHFRLATGETGSWYVDRPLSCERDAAITEEWTIPCDASISYAAVTGAVRCSTGEAAWPACSP